MSKKGENIFKRQDGRWEARYIKGYELSGKIKYGYCYGKTYREAKEKVETIKANIRNTGIFPGKKEKYRISSYCDEWLQIQRIKIKESTYVRYKTVVQKYIIRKIGNCSIQSVNEKLVDKFTQELLMQEGLSAKTVKDILVVLHSILKYAARQNSGTFSMIQITYPKECKKDIRILSLEEEIQFISFLNQDMDECKFGILLTLFTGIRIGELCALRWENISIKNKTLYINATMQRIKNITEENESKTKIIIDTPKSDTSIRIIPLKATAPFDVPSL